MITSIWSHDFFQYRKIENFRRIIKYFPWTHEPLAFMLLFLFFFFFLRSRKSLTFLTSQKQKKGNRNYLKRPLSITFENFFYVRYPWCDRTSV